MQRTAIILIVALGLAAELCAQKKKSNLSERTLERRAIEAVIWGMPAVNYERMLQATIDNGAKLNQVVYWSRPVNWKNQTLTPNPDTIYLTPCYDTTNGPVVVEIPPADADHYPLGGNPDSTVFVDAYDKPFDATIPYDATFFELLDRFVQAEPWLTRDKAMIESLKTIGIEKGKPFKPDAKKRTILDNPAREAHEVIAQKCENGFVPPFFDGTHWGLPIPKETANGLGSDFADPNEYGLDGRAVMYHMGYFSAKHPGTGQFYLLSTVDRTGKLLQGNKTYRLTVPANAPIQQYWSATACDRETHALIREMSRASLASNNKAVQKNPDGSTDITSAPKRPRGKNLTGYRPIRRGGSSYCSACTAQRRSCSRKPGSCPTSRK